MSLALAPLASGQRLPSAGTSAARNAEVGDQRRAGQTVSGGVLLWLAHVLGPPRHEAYREAWADDWSRPSAIGIDRLIRSYSKFLASVDLA